MPNAKQVEKNKAEEPEATQQGFEIDYKGYLKMDKLVADCCPNIGPFWAHAMLLLLLKKGTVKIQEVETVAQYIAHRVQEQVEAQKEKRIIVPTAKVPGKKITLTDDMIKGKGNGH